MATAKKPPATSEWVHVTPRQAHTWLGQNLDNRKIRRLRVSTYAHDMLSEHWVPTHQGIAFDDEGILRDGQHRLMAIVEADVPVWMLVTKGLDPTAQRYMDRGASRRVSDFMAGVNGAARVSAARYLLALRALEGEATAQQLARAAREITDADIHNLFEQEPGLADDLEEMSTSAGRAARNLTGMGPSPLLTAGALYPDLAHHIFDGLSTGAGLDVNSPILALRNYRGSGLSQTSTGVHTAIRIFQFVRDNKTMAKLQVVGVEGAIKVTPR